MSLISKTFKEKFVFGILLIFFYLYVIAITFAYLKNGKFPVKPFNLQLLVVVLILVGLYFKRYYSQIIFIATFSFYISFIIPTPSGDLIPVRFSPYWLDGSQNFNFETILDAEIHKKIENKQLDRYQNQIILLPHNRDRDFILLPYYFVYANNTILPTYPIIPILTSYIIYNFSGKLIFPLPKIEQRKDIDSALNFLYAQEKISSALIASISCVFLFFILKNFPTNLYKKSAFILTLIYGLCTSHFSISSQGMWQHGMVEILFLASIYLVTNLKKYSLIYSFFLGTVITLAFFSRPNSIILLAYPLSILLFKEKLKILISKEGIIVIFSFLISFIIFSYLNFNLYSNILGGYPYMRSAKVLVGYADLFNYPFVKGLISLLFSPGFGLFIFSPFLIYFFLSLFRKKHRIISICILITASLYVCFYSKYIFWEGGHSYGARFLTDMNPLFIISIGLIYPLLKRINFLKFTFGFLVIISFFVQIIGSQYKIDIALWNSCEYKNSFEKAWDHNNTPYLFPFSGKSCK